MKVKERNEKKQQEEKAESELSPNAKEKARKRNAGSGRRSRGERDVSDKKSTTRLGQYSDQESDFKADSNENLDIDQLNWAEEEEKDHGHYVKYKGYYMQEEFQVPVKIFITE